MADPDPAAPQPMPDEAGDAFVAHATPPPGTRSYGRAAVAAGLVVAIVIALVVWIVVAR
jgi:uncharacterized membrane protein YccC